MVKTSILAWEKASDIIIASINHPFNQEMKDGILLQEKFFFYLEQDKHFLLNFAKSLAVIATKVNSEIANIFITHSEHCFIAEQMILLNKPNFIPTNQITKATADYSSFLLRSSIDQSPEIAIAAILPCFWVYLAVGLDLAPAISTNHPYATWINNYTSQAFKDSVAEMIGIFDVMAGRSSDPVKQDMIDVFCQSAEMELKFWDEVYYPRKSSCHLL